MVIRQPRQPLNDARVVVIGVVGCALGLAPGFMDDLLKLTKGDKNAPVALICRTGNRTTQVQRYLEAQGFTQVFNVREGMAGSAAGPGWLRRGLPLQ